jgi:hypothetical protein
MDNKLSLRTAPKLSDDAPKDTHRVVIEIVKPD